MAGEGPVTVGEAGRPHGSLWAITAYFNPARYRRRLENYRTFRARLDVPLVAVELAYGPEFELGEGDADVLIQLRGLDVMWQKERLLNLALQALPDECGKVVWMDCDLVVESTDWSGRLSALLDRHPLVQAFSRLSFLSADWTQSGAATSIMWTQPGVLALLADAGTDSLASPVAIGPDSSCKGGAWAAQRGALEEYGIYDACIIGGGDLALAAALHGRFDVATRTMNERQADHYLRWARPCMTRLGRGPVFSKARCCICGTVTAPIAATASGMMV